VHPRDLKNVSFFVLSYKFTAIWFIIKFIIRHKICGAPYQLEPRCMWLIHQFGSLLNLSICKEYPIMARAKSPRNGNTRNKQVANTSSANPASQVKKNSSEPDLEAEIRRRAYQLYEQRGCTPGRENEDWLVAEREILGRYNPQQTA